MNPARMCLESLDRRPVIREQPGSKGDIASYSAHVRYTPGCVEKVEKCRVSKIRAKSELIGSFGK
jgi:hypothetical protein